MGELFGGARLPNYLEPSTKNSNVPEPKGCFTDWLAEPRPSVRQRFETDAKPRLHLAVRLEPGKRCFVPSRVVDCAGRRLGKRLGVASRRLDDRAVPPRKSLGRSGASPHQC
jgi:hypothetical protein